MEAQRSYVHSLSQKGFPELTRFCPRSRASQGEKMVGLERIATRPHTQKGPSASLGNDWGPPTSLPRAPHSTVPNRAAFQLSTDQVLEKRKKKMAFPSGHSESPSFLEEAVASECPSHTGHTLRLPLPPTWHPLHSEGQMHNKGLLTSSPPRQHQHQNGSPKPSGFSARPRAPAQAPMPRPRDQQALCPPKPAR